MKIKIDINLKISKVIRYIVLADLLFLGSWALIHPIFSIFVIEKVRGATLVTVGLVSALYWLVKSIFQIPVSKYLDRVEGEKDDFFALFLALILAAIASFSFAITKSLWQLFATQFLYAIAFGLYVPSWTAIFSRHLDRRRISFNWSLDSTAIGLASFFAAIFSGILANWLGFSFVFFIVGCLCLLSAFVIFFIPNLIVPPKDDISGDNQSIEIRDHTPAGIGK